MTAQNNGMFSYLWVNLELFSPDQDSKLFKS